MKIWIFFISLFLSFNACAQNDSLSFSRNREEKLVYHAAILSADKEQQHEFKSLMEQRISHYKWDVTVGENMQMYPDLAFVMDGDLGPLHSKEGLDCMAVQLKFPGQESIACDTVIEVSGLEDAVTKSTKLLGKLYYQGLRPVYSSVFVQGTEGYTSYRIPSLLSLPNGRILAITEARQEGKTDCAENNLVLKYSDDEGKQWSNLVLMAEAGKASLNNPTAVYIEELNRILVLFQQYPPKMHEGVTHTGLEGDGVTRFFVIHSDDNGETWSEKHDITVEAKLPQATSYASGPGIAIRVTTGPDKGRILVPVNVSGGARKWYNYLVASDDLGASWKIISGSSAYGTNESQIIQVSDTEFLINARCHRYEGDDYDYPEGWNPWNFDKVTRNRGEIPVTILGDKAVWGNTKVRLDMPDPTCQGAIFRYSGLRNNEISRVLFSNAATQLSHKQTNVFRPMPPARMNGVVRLSYDEGKTWKWSKRIYGNRFTEFQYSVLTRLASGKIGCFFETGADMRFALFDMEWLSSGEDQGEKTY